MVLSGNQGHTIYCHTLIDLMQLCSASKKRLSTARVAQQTPAHCRKIVKGLNQELKEIRQYAEEHYDLHLDGSMVATPSSNHLSLLHVHSLRSYYACLLLDINAHVVFPWSPAANSLQQKEQVSSQTDTSCLAVAEISRWTILATRHIRVDASCPSL